MSSLTVPTIRTAAISDEECVFVALTLAFSANPAVRWMYPDPHQFLTSFPCFAKAFGGRALVAETAQCVDDYSGAALWLAPDTQPDERTLMALLESTVSEPRRSDVFAVFEWMGAYHPHEPHWYLPLIGVEPSRQRRGLGAGLMRPALAACDRDNRSAYLESTNPENISLYERLGFVVLGEIRVGSSPPIYPMLRQRGAAGIDHAASSMSL